MLSGLGAVSDYYRYDKNVKQISPLSSSLMAGVYLMRGGINSAIGSPLQGLEAALGFVTQVHGTTNPQVELMNFATQATGAMLTAPIGGTITRQLGRVIPVPTEKYPPATEYEATEVGGKLIRYVPVVNSWLLQPRLNIFGEPFQATPLYNIVGVPNVVPSKEADPVVNYLAEHPDIHLSMPGNTGTVAQIKMTPEEVYQHHLARGPFLRQQLNRLFSEPSFSNLSGPEQNNIVKHMSQAATRVGNAAVIRYRQEHPVTPERRQQALEARGILVPAAKPAGE
jgi:hypothetical protein